MNSALISNRLWKIANKLRNEFQSLEAGNDNTLRLQAAEARGDHYDQEQFTPE